MTALGELREEASGILSRLGRMAGRMAGRLPQPRLPRLSRPRFGSPGQLVLFVAFAVVLGAIAHIVSILAMPALAERNAYARLSEMMESNVLTMLADPTPQQQVLPTMDPAFIAAICLYDLSQAPLKVRVPATADYTSVSFYTSEALAFYALSDQAAGRVIELELMTASQKAALPEDEEITAADRLVIESPTREGIVAVRAFVRERGMRDLVRRQLEAATCAPSN
ncbi:DUF1254 domain-containing protein [Xanthobacter sp. KR7-65]|uniref:DUF1254 domain-containing protein n=1 Tax=Xanthobacter sp. KR7-65 TaxID=3156612 RepID=UPI0032B428C2